MLREIKVCVTFHSTNTVCDIILQSEAPNTTNEYTKSGIYRLACSTCKHSYVGQMSQNLKHKYQEHGNCTTNNDPLSAFARRILNSVHEHRPISSILLPKPLNRGPFVKAFAQCYIQLYSCNNQFISDQCLGEYNPLY